MNQWTRRRYVQSLGVAGTVALAGCGGDSGSGGDDGSTNSGPAEFESVAVSGPRSITVGSSFSLTVSAKNVGGEEGDYEDTLVVAEGNKEFSQEIEIDDVAAGKTGEAEVGPLTLAYGDDYVFELEEAEASYSVTAAPATAGLSETLSVSDALDVTLTDLSFEDTVGYRHTESRGLFNERNVPDTLGAPSGKVLAIVRLSVENTGTDTATLSQDDLIPENGAFYDSLPKRNDLQSEFIEGEPLFDGGGRRRVQPSQQLDGWLLAQFDRESARNGVRIGMQRDAAETPFEKAFEVTPENGQFGFPDFELTSITSPDQVQKNAEYTFEFTVKNTGDAAGQFHGVEQWYSEDDQTWFADSLSSETVFRTEIEAGATASWTVTSSSAIANTYEYRITPFSERWSISFSE